MWWCKRFLIQQFCLCALGFSLSLCPASAYSETLIMSDHCGEVINMKDRLLSMVHVKLTDGGVYRPHMSCSLTVLAPPQHRLTMVMEWMDIAKGSFSTCADFLSVRNGDLTNKTGYIEGFARVCGKEAPPSVTSQGQTLTLHFDSNTLDDGAGFSAIITAYHLGECNTEEFGCDNGRCIDKRLKCDDFDNCGDDSDDCMLSVGGVVLAVIITAIIFFLIVGAVALYFNRDKLRRKKKCPMTCSTTNPDGVYQPTTEPVTAPSGTDTAATV